MIIVCFIVIAIAVAVVLSSNAKLRADVEARLTALEAEAKDKL